MIVTMMDFTEKPIELISLAAGNCYGKNDAKAARVRRCIEAGHTSVLEHAKATFKVEGISRACANQLVRHRMASYCQLSQRYARVDTSGGDWYVKPPMTDIGLSFTYEMEAERCGELYERLLQSGVKPEDARYVLPESTKTDIVVTMNARELAHFLTLRLDRAAQWEIRKLAENVRTLLSFNEDWRQLMEWCGLADEEACEE